MAKVIFELNTQKIIEAEKNRDKDEKLFYRLMDNAIYGKAKEGLKNKTDERLLSNKKDYLKWTSKPGYHKKYLIIILCQFVKTKLH